MTRLQNKAKLQEEKPMSVFMAIACRVHLDIGVLRWAGHRAAVGAVQPCFRLHGIAHTGAVAIVRPAAAPRLTRPRIPLLQNNTNTMRKQECMCVHDRAIVRPAATPRLTVPGSPSCQSQQYTMKKPNDILCVRSFATVRLATTTRLTRHRVPSCKKEQTKMRKNKKTCMYGIRRNMLAGLQTPRDLKQDLVQ